MMQAQPPDHGRREAEHQPALAAVDDIPARVGAMTVDAGCAVAWRPAHERAVREERVTGRASLGRDLFDRTVRSESRTHVRMSHVNPTDRKLSCRGTSETNLHQDIGDTLDRLGGDTSTTRL